ncbi:enoyl-CoA hydratase/isomerase family protein [Variovorax sp. DT-64]|uniref:enoyl-CoA hydratase/isomerase family protein n=1 Tax=Variovorax sp. DT-64 TaxID=3396160 RepID=UPI003F1D5200
MSEALIGVENRASVRIVTMTGVPRRGNPMSPELGRALLNALSEAMADEQVRCVVLAGTPTYFCVGADLVDVAKLQGVQAILVGWLDELDAIRRMPKPIIAAVRGYAVGGGFELALYCDLIVAAEDARFALPETGIGVIAGQGGSQRLIGLAGRAIAADLVLTGRELSGLEARSHGIAARAVPASEVLETAIGMAEAIAKRSAPAVAFAREVILEASEGPLRQSLRIERLLAAVVLDTAEAKTRIGNFLERRSATKPAGDRT